MQRLIVDRFEGAFVICEDENRNSIRIEKSKLPKTAKEGSCLFLSESGTIRLDKKRTEDRTEKIRELMRNIESDI